MHPQLEAERFHSCLDFIQALDKCHQAEYYKRALGLCNNEKEALTKCLHEARLEGERRYIKESREKQKVIHAKWKQIEEEQYGEDAILKKIIQRQVAKKQQEQADNSK
ncbi:LAFE_0B01706g1_1 [Lachancea fermentati]|uniref:COX assembly mitochondrial protein n=1 Tax=Lachancea fermentati TaxID=4955 RepID=A0A1G4M7D2_LACFM|nr:LAFE_0B01706g1_1 [Lachancea fermentati]